MIPRCVYSVWGYHRQKLQGPVAISLKGVETKKTPCFCVFFLHEKKTNLVCRSFGVSRDSLKGLLEAHGDVSLEQRSGSVDLVCSFST